MKRRKWTPTEKLMIVLEGLKVIASEGHEVCDDSTRQVSGGVVRMGVAYAVIVKANMPKLRVGMPPGSLSVGVGGQEGSIWSAVSWPRWWA